MCSRSRADNCGGRGELGKLDIVFRYNNWGLEPESEEAVEHSRNTLLSSTHTVSDQAEMILKSSKIQIISTSISYLH